MLKAFPNFLYGSKINGYSQTFGLSYGPRKSLLSRTMLLPSRTESFKLQAAVHDAHRAARTNTKLDGFLTEGGYNFLFNSAFFERMLTFEVSKTNARLR